MNVIDLFCGAVGGWSDGLRRAGYRTVAACEIVPWRRAVFGINHPGCIMYDDVRELTAERIGNDLGYLPDAVVGSPPCQEISAANSQGEGITDDHLFWEWARLVFEIRPVWAGAENSPQSRTKGIDGILDALGKANYAFWPCVVGADNAGANHRRKRLWLIAADRARLGRVDAHSSKSNSVGGHSDRGRRGRAQTHEGNGVNAFPIDTNAEGQRGGGWKQSELGSIQGTSLGFPNAEADGIAPDANGTRHALGPRLGCHDGPELPPALRDIGLAWPNWNGGLAGLTAACAAAGFGLLDDGANTPMAPNLRNSAIAALGDAVVSQIPEAIGRAMWMISANPPDDRPIEARGDLSPETKPKPMKQESLL